MHLSTKLCAAQTSVDLEVNDDVKSSVTIGKMPLNSMGELCAEPLILRTPDVIPCCFQGVSGQSNQGDDAVSASEGSGFFFSLASSQALGLEL